MDAEALCTCGCPYRRHVPTIGAGVVTLHCLRCACASFTPAELPPAPSIRSTLIYAWSSWWCPACGRTSWRVDEVCHGEPMTAVRLEMHSRDSPG